MLFHTRVLRLFMSPLVSDAGLFEHNVHIRSDMNRPEETAAMIDDIYEEIIYMIGACCTIAHLLSGL